MALKDTLAAVRAQVVANVTAGIAAGVPVYDYWRNLADEATRNSVLKDTGGKLHVWMVGLSAESPLLQVAMGPNVTQGDLHFEANGYLALADATATEKTFDAEVCDVLDVFRADKHLNALAINAWPISRTAGGWVQLANVLCHYARLNVTVRVKVEC